MYQWKCVALSSGSEKEFSSTMTYSAYVPDVARLLTSTVSQSPLICTDTRSIGPDEYCSPRHRMAINSMVIAMS